MNVPMGLENLSLTREYEAWLRAGDARERAEEEMQRAYLDACARGDASAPVPLAPLVQDWSLAYPDSAGRKLAPLRNQTLSECMFESLYYPNGPKHEELHQLFLLAAAGQNIADEAQALLQRMATEFARINASGGE